MRVSALLLGLAAGLFALLAPIALRSDLMTSFMALWSDTPNDILIGRIIWFGIPAAAALGGLLAIVVPGFAALVLAAAALGWVGIGLALPQHFDYRLLGPAAGAGLAAVLAMVAAELAERRRRMERRRLRVPIGTGSAPHESEREAALRMDPLVLPREPASPPTQEVQLEAEDLAAHREPVGPPPRFEDLDVAARRQRAHFWGEAIRAESEAEAESEASPEAEAPIEAEAEPYPDGDRGFRWDRADAPAGQWFASSPAAPRIVEARPIEQPAPPPPPPPVPAAAAPRPPVTASELLNWPEPEAEAIRWQSQDSAPRRRGSGLAAALLAVFAVLLLALVAAGGYLAYRDGWIDRIAALVAPRAATAPVAADASQATAPQAAATEQLPVEPASAAIAPTVSATLDHLPSSPSTASPPAATAAAAYADPFAYCGAVGTVDYVDQRYSGPMIPPAVTTALSIPDNASRDRVHWRCSGGVVLACASYIGPVCDLVPTLEEMRDYCVRYPDVAQLLAPGGPWSCVGGQPKLPPGANWRVDRRGFGADSWVVVRAPATPAG